jgi:hypothetical protein
MDDLYNINFNQTVNFIKLIFLMILFTTCTSWKTWWSLSCILQKTSKMAINWSKKQKTKDNHVFFISSL